MWFHTSPLLDQVTGYRAQGTVRGTGPIHLCPPHNLSPVPYNLKGSGRGLRFHMRLSDFDYELPADLIAQEPTPERAGSRLLVVDRQSGHLSHCSFLDVLHLLPADCLLVLNDTRVFPARLHGRKESGGSVEVLLLRRLAGEGETWEVLCKGGQNVRAGARLWFAPELWATWLSAPHEGRGVLRLFPQEDLHMLLERL